LRELRRLRGERGEDLKITAVLAHVLASQDRLVEARRELRRGLARHPFGRNQVDYAELVANLAFLELRVGQRTRGEVLAELRKQIDAIDGQSLALALMFADLVHRTTARTEVARLYDGLLRHESEEDLLPLKVRLLLFEQDYESARREVRRWVEVAPLNPDAAQTLVTIEGQIFADFASAAKVGREALKRFPGYVLLRNNVAFALALSDQIAEAQAILGESREDEPPFLYATRGLIALAAGSIQEGLDLYDKAVASADEQGGDSESAIEFRRLARAYEWLGLQKFGLATGDLPSERCDVVLPDDWQVDNNYLILRELAARIGAPWPPGSDHKG
jgi:tetratricopeptide (TPR) repeat protein